MKRLWKPTGTKTLSWDSSDGHYRIVVTEDGRFRLISFFHEETPDGEYRFWDFRTLAEAKDYTDCI